MNDFIFTSNSHLFEELGQPLKDLMPEPDLVNVKKYSGKWGALAVSSGPYNGFDVYEDDKYICIVIGGPVLYWRDNDFLTDTNSSNEATQAILIRWLSGEADWSEDISGPFVIFIINKESKEFFCYTDLMMFIPVYQYSIDNGFYIGSHVDVVAKIARQRESEDEVSIADFILHGIVTHPHTIYQNVFQLMPATKHHWSFEDNRLIERRDAYWLPLENNPYKNINEAAIALRHGLTDYIDRVTENMTEVGQFISAGEDSRSIAGMLPERLKKHAYLYVDSKNREFRIAKRVAEVYGCEFHYILRSPTHYLDIFPIASKLVGSGQQYTHAHALGLAKKSGADKHLAVFGGYASDSLLKAMHIRKLKHWSKFSFLPDIEIKGETRTKPIKSEVFSKNILLGIDNRRKVHMDYVKPLRPTTYHEWFMLWPYSMREAMPNLSVNRRLFSSYEIFTNNSVVKISAAIPTYWKMNRRIFYKVNKNYLYRSKFIPHGDGRFPFYPWWINSFIGLPMWFNLRVKPKIVTVKNQGPWGNWKDIEKSEEFKDLSKVMEDLDANSNTLNISQRLNKIQISFLIKYFSEEKNST